MVISTELLRSLMARVDDSSDATAQRDAIVIWLALHGAFSPLLGRASVQVLFMRSLNLNRTTFLWLPSSSRNGVGDLFCAFETALRKQPAEEVVRATHALLRSFVHALSTLIGQTLTEKCVCSAIGNERASTK
jgi:hypothetical protein